MGSGREEDSKLQQKKITHFMWRKKLGWCSVQAGQNQNARSNFPFRGNGVGGLRCGNDMRVIKEKLRYTELKQV